MVDVNDFDFTMELIGRIEMLRWKDEPMNELAFVWKEGYETAMDNCLNELRRKL